MVERSRLGRGLDFFLSGNRDDNAVPGEIAQVDVGQLVPNPHQPRREFSAQELTDLAASIRSSGVLQPVLARRVGERLQIVAGERRWRAAKQAGLATIPVIVREITDEQAAVFGLVENLHREDLNPIEKARGFKRLQDIVNAGRKDNAGQDEVARQVGLDRSTVANFIRLLDLPGEVQALVSRGTLSMGQARALLGLKDDRERLAVAEQAVRKRLSVRDVEALVKSLKTSGGAASGGGGASSPTKRPPWIKEIEDTLGEILDTPIGVRYGRKRATITIECAGRDEFERVYELLKSIGS